MTQRPVKHIVLAVVLLFGAEKGVTRGEEIVARNKPLLIAGSWSGYHSQSQVAIDFRKATGQRINVVGQNNRRVFEWLAAERIDVGMWSPMPLRTLATEMEKHFPDKTSRPRVFSVGQFAIYVVVNQANPTRRLTLAQLRGIYTGSIKHWSDVGIGGGKITLIGEPKQTKSREILKNKSLGLGPQFARDMSSVLSYGRVINAVAKDRSAIGFFLYKQEPIKGVRVIALASDGQGPFVLPDADNIFTESYPLRQHFYLIVRQDAHPMATEYCKFACGQEGGAIAKEWYMHPEFERQQWLTSERLKLLKAGKGEKVGISGTGSNEILFQELALKYVEAEKVVQAGYRKKDLPAEAVKEFQTGGSDLLLVEGDVDGLEGQLKKGVKTVPLGKSALGVIAHADRKLTSISLEELRQICSGELKNWPEAEGDGPPIRGYGLNHTHPVMEIYRKQLTQREESEREGAGLLVNSRADNQKVIRSVVQNSAGIGFVDLSQMPPLDGSVVLVGLVDKDGKVSKPTLDQVPEDYPLVKPFTLFVSPTAGEAARKLADWLEKNPCEEVLTRHYLVPMAGGKRQ